MALYDDIGHDYDDTRKADSLILDNLCDCLNAHKSNYYLEIGCGTGNYLIGMFERGYKNIVGLDPSELMLNTAREKCKGKGIERDPSSWIHAFAENLPFQNDFFDGVFCINALHHIKKRNRGSVFNSVFHVLRNGGRFVIFTSSHAQIDRYWLNYYFPKAMETLKSYMPEINTITSELRAAGFKNISTKPYFIDENLTDLFLYSRKYEPKAYLDENFRNNMSLFKVKIIDRKEITTGLKLLSNDCSSGEVYGIINREKYDNIHLGDYSFIVCEK